jgi:hypothetical protein
MKKRQPRRSKETCQICNPAFKNPECTEREAVYGCENLKPGHDDHNCDRTLEHSKTGGHREL